MLKIGELARSSGLGVGTIRYFERLGLLRSRSRTGGGYHLFGDADLERLEFIQRAQRIGLTLREIGDILAIRSASQPTCEHVRSVLEARLEDAELALRELAAFRDHLRGLLARVTNLDACRPIRGCRPRGSGKRVSLSYHRWLTKTTEEEAQAHVQDTTKPATCRASGGATGADGGL